MSNVKQEDEVVATKTSNFDINNYTYHKTIASGALNVALLTSNATHLKELFKKGKNDYSAYYFTIVLICISVVLQFGMAILTAMIGGSNVDLESTDSQHDERKRMAHKKNRTIMALAVLTTLVNVLADSFYSDGIPNLNNISCNNSTVHC